MAIYQLNCVLFSLSLRVVLYFLIRSVRMNVCSVSKNLIKYNCVDGYE